jgi:hypothetical protein
MAGAPEALAGGLALPGIECVAAGEQRRRRARGTAAAAGLSERATRPAAGGNAERCGENQEQRASLKHHALPSPLLHFRARRRFEANAGGGHGHIPVSVDPSGISHSARHDCKCTSRWTSPVRPGRPLSRQPLLPRGLSHWCSGHSSLVRFPSRSVSTGCGGQPTSTSGRPRRILAIACLRTVTLATSALAELATGSETPRVRRRSGAPPR